MFIYDYIKKACSVRKQAFFTFAGVVKALCKQQGILSTCPVRNIFIP
jgi:hypothetical protein